MLVRVRLVPGAKTDQIVGQEAGIYKIRLMAPPIDGRANEALIRFLADQLDIAPSRISIIKGHTSKHKTLDIPLSEDALKKGLCPPALC
jgi:uncharacterized protein (TIGR00251 family)